MVAVHACNPIIQEAQNWKVSVYLGYLASLKPVWASSWDLVSKMKRQKHWKTDFLEESFSGAGEMAQQAQAFITKPDSLTSIPGTHSVEEGTNPWKGFSDLHMSTVVAYMHTQSK